MLSISSIDLTMLLSESELIARRWVCSSPARHILMNSKMSTAIFSLKLKNVKETGMVTKMMKMLMKVLINLVNPVLSYSMVSLEML